MSFDMGPQAKRARLEALEESTKSAQAVLSALANAPPSAALALPQPQAAAQAAASPLVQPLTQPIGSVVQAQAYTRLAQAAHARMYDIHRPRVYVGNLDAEVSEQEILQIFSAFGVVTGIDMPKEGASSRGFCFVEYLEQRHADTAIGSLQDFMLGGRKMRVGQPTTLRRHTPAPSTLPAPLSAPMMQLAGAAPTPAPGPPPALVQVNVQGPAPAPVPAPALVPTPGPAAVADAQVSKPAENDEARRSTGPVEVLLLENLVAPGEVDEDLAGEVREECGRFGRIKKVKVHEMGPERLVRVFVRFADGGGGSRAAAAMDGRWFGKRKVRAVRYSEEAFAAGELDRPAGAD